MFNSFDQFIHQSSLLFMALVVLVCILIGSLFFLKKSGQAWANRCFGTMLILAGTTQLHYCFDYGGYFRTHPEWRFYPLYFNLWLPVLLFYYIKLTLYPNYRLRGSDLKHFALPIGQLIYFLLMWLIPSWRHPEGRWFYSPFYGGLEQALFLFMVPTYLIFSLQYFRRSKRSGDPRPSGSKRSPQVLIRALRPEDGVAGSKRSRDPRRSVSNKATSAEYSVPSSQRPHRIMSRTHWYIYQLMRGTSLFWLAYAVIALVDFFAYKFWVKDLREISWFAAFGALSFTGLLYGWCLYGFQVLVWGRNLRIGRRQRK
ncbi:MAG: hypothetical protein AAF433_09375 [Bacteroidota bacterium]